MELVHRVELLGAKEPFNFFLIRLPALQPLPQGSFQYCNCLYYRTFFRKSSVDDIASISPFQPLALPGLTHGNVILLSALFIEHQW